MTDTYRFKCSHCGQCCINTVTETELGRFGAFLIPHERILFPEQYVRPLFGVGIRGKTRPRPRVIYAYQNISKPCVWYDEDLKECLIYDRRPLTCMEFPLSMYRNGVMLHRECPQIAKLLPEGVSCKTDQLRGLETEIEATKKMTIYFMGVFVLNVHNVDLQYCWAYDLNVNKWVQWTQDQLVRFTNTADDKVKAL